MMPEPNPAGPYGQAAADYWQAGWRGVIRLPPNSKKPPPNGWTGRGGAWPSRSDVQAWIDSDGDGNIALRLPDTIIGLDVDNYSNKQGALTLAEAEAKWGPLPPTWRSTSRDDGVSGIRLYRVPAGLAWPGEVGPAIEIIQHIHRYVVVWPSLHPEGRVYRWITPDNIVAITTIPYPEDAAELPAAWIRGLTGGRAADDILKADLNDLEVVAWLVKHGAGEPCGLMAGEIDRYLNNRLTAGSRHDAAKDATARLAHLAAEGHTGAYTAIERIRTTFAQIAEADPTRPRDPGEWQRLLTGAIRLAAVNQHEEQPADPCTLVTILHDPTPADAHAAARERFPVLDWHALWEDETEEEWLIEPVIAKRRLISLYSAPKVGKSLLMLELAVAIARGVTALGAPAAEPQVVLYVDFENDPRGDIRERLESMGVKPDDLDNLKYMSYPAIAKFDTDQGGRELLAAALAYQATVIVIDTVSRAVAGDENENDTWLNFYRHTGLKLKQAEIACIRLDHSGKDEQRGQRGGSAKSGDVDAVWRLSKITDDTFRLTCEANRMPIHEKELVFERGGRPLTHKVAGNAAAAAGDARKRDLFAIFDAAADSNGNLTYEAAQAALKAKRGRGMKTTTLGERLQEWKLYGRVSTITSTSQTREVP